MEQRPRILPNNLEAEQSLLGCLFISQDACADIFPMIKAIDFYSIAHQKIYQAMLDNYMKNIAVDYVTVSKVLEVKGELEEVGGLGYITDLTNYVPSAANFKYYADIVRNDSVLRQIIEASQRTINEAFENEDASKVLEGAEKSIFDIAQTRRVNGLEHIKKGVAEVIDMLEKVSIDPNANAGIKTGFPTLDKITNGFKPGELIIIAARPGIGKTTLAVNFAVNSAIKYGKSVAMFDLEMSALQVAQRFICSTGRVPMDMVKGGTKDNNVWATLFETKKILENSNIYIDDTTSITPAEILSKCRRLKVQNGLDMVIIDYLQLMKGEKQSKDGNRQLSDLRESGSIEQDADIVMFIADIASEEAKDQEDMDGALDYSLVIAKHRNGMRGTIPIKWKSEFTQFYEPGKDTLYTRNTSKVQKQDDAVLTPVESSDDDDVFKD